MKDNFSNQAGLYAKFRPTYPAALIEAVARLAPSNETAWDCATGNGQVAQLLAPFFQKIWATDISEKQLANAPTLPNVTYRTGSAEQSGFPARSFDLITVGQAIHWFDHGRFNAEVRRTAKPGGILAAFGYPLLNTDGPLNGCILHFYENIVGKYWDEERRHLDDRYARIPFPFERVEMPRFELRYEWDLAQLAGYLQTWSAVQHCLRSTGDDPVRRSLPDIQAAWGGAVKKAFVFEILTLVGRVG